MQQISSDGVNGQDSGPPALIAAINDAIFE
jgi:hypothetical protein